MSYTPSEFVDFRGITFGRATESYNETTVHPFTREEEKHIYQGLPLFDGDPEHLDCYIELLLSEIGRDGLIASVTEKPVFGHYAGGTYEVPYALPFSNDVSVHQESQWPTGMGFAQTWNRELLRKAGQACGEEIRGKTEVSTIRGTALSNAYTGMIDIRYFPHNGRFDEGYGEDPKIISDMAAAWADGMTGRNSDNDLYYQVIPQTKHWASYHGEFFRNQNISNVSVRSFYEQNAKTIKKAFESGAFLGLMSSYGAINGVPSTSSFVQKYAQDISKNGLMTICDAGSETGYVPETAESWGFSNGYDKAYSSDFSDRAANMLLAGHTPGRGSGFGFKKPVDMRKKITTAIDQGILGLTEEELKAAALPFFYAAVRIGAFDERDENGVPKYYPFSSQAKGGRNRRDHSDPRHQKIALQAAEESIVLTKNDGTLPLQKGSAAVFGPMADIVQYGLYSSKLSDPETYSETAPAGISIVEALRLKLGADQVHYESGGKIIRLLQNGKYLTVHDDNSLTFETESSDADLFELFDWGQTVVSIRSEKTGKWISTGARNTMFDRPDKDDEFDDPGFIPGPGATMPAGKHPNCNRDLTVYANGEASFRMNPDAHFPDFGFPEFLEKKYAADGFVYKCGSKFNTVDFGTRSAAPGLMGWYLQEKNGKLMVDADPSSSLPKAMETERSGFANGNIFKEEIVRIAGGSADASSDCAIIVLGMPYNGICGEGTDRITISLAEDQLKMAHEAAAVYAAAGKKTVVIIKMDGPAAVQELQDDSNINAILIMPMGGQYEAAALTNILYGDAAPSGRLNATWYRCDGDLPQITDYTLPYHAAVEIPGAKGPHYVTREEINARIDFTAVDIMQSRLGYQYLEKPVTYPFGYGLSYTVFSFSDLETPDTVEAGEGFSIKVRVENTGSRDGAEVLQLYICPKGSSYGEFAPKKILAAYEKINLAAGEKSIVEMAIDPEAFALWDVNACRYIVEHGVYDLILSEDSSLTAANTLVREISVRGNSISELPVSEPIVLWKRSFGAKNMVYREYKKAHTAEVLKMEKSHWDEMFCVMSTASDSWIVLKNVPLNAFSHAMLTAATERESSCVTLHIDSVGGPLLSAFNIEKTGAACYPRFAKNPGFDAGIIHELAYEEYCSDLSSAEGIHDIYVVFDRPDVRAFSLSFE